MKTSITLKKIYVSILILITPTLIYSQNLITPEASQKAMVMQRIGLTDITVSYHSPLVKDRKIRRAQRLQSYHHCKTRFGI